MSGMRVGISRPLSTAIIEGGNGLFELAIGMEARVAWAWAWDGNLYLLLLEWISGKGHRSWHCFGRQGRVNEVIPRHDECCLELLDRSV